MTRKKSKPPYIICGVNCREFGCEVCSPPSVLEANQKMCAERFAKINHNKRNKNKSDQGQQQRRERDFDFDVGPI